MDLGLIMFTTEYTISAMDLARAAEEHGFESLWFPEHTHIPVSRESPYPGGGPLPKEYIHVADPFVALTAAAAVTTNLRIGTGLCLVVERDPIITAKAAATLDLVSGGRLLFGVGGGWNREELRNHGTDPRTRMALMKERVEAIKTIWTQEVASYHGDLVDFDEIWSWPKPVQDPHPPVIIGGNGPTVLDRVLDYGDAWAPLDAADIPKRVAELRQRCEDSGHGHVPVSVFTYSPDAEKLQRLADAGVDRCVLFLKPDEPAPTRERISRYAQFLT